MAVLENGRTMASPERQERRLSRTAAAGALLAALAVAFGAFGAHALKARLGAVELGWWETAVQYQMWHAVALVALGQLAPGRMHAPALMMLGWLVVAWRALRR